MTRSSEQRTIAQLLAHATRQLDTASARLDAEILLAHALDKPRSHLHAWPDKVPAPPRQARFDALLARRAFGEPVAYLTGQREFWSLALTVSRDTLIPRPETETLVAHALSVIADDRCMEIADLGTGSGAIALAIAHERPYTRILATDCSKAALAIARANAQRLGIANVAFMAGDWCDALDDRQYDLLVSNPPYIPEQDRHLAEGDVRFEPRSALASGSDGMSALTAIARCARRHLRTGGWLMLEHGYDQQAAVVQLLQSLGYRDIADYPDDAGLSRVVCGRL
jgi:release factor glutamine methyltransferase